MTAITLLNGDWEYQFEDETNGAAANVVGTRMLRYLGGPVRTVNEVYSALADAADDFQAMGFKNPMLPVTPNAYTMENSAFISRASTEKLKEGTITADWGLKGIAGNNAGRGVLRVEYTGGTNFVADDIGREVVQGGTDAGTLLDFEIEPDGTLVAWIRPQDATNGTGDEFGGTGALVVTGGTGSTTSSVAAISLADMQTRYTAVQAIGSVPTATEVYIVQNRLKLADSNTASATAGAFNFWSTDTGVSLGIISVLIRTQKEGTLIQDGDLEVFSRKYGSLYDNFRLNVSAGGFSALPLASAADINNTTGYQTFTGSSGVNQFDVGNAIYAGVSDAITAHAIDPSGTNVDETVDFNSAAATDVNPFPTQLAGDYFAIGYDKPFTGVQITIATAGTGAGTLDWEYWDGAAWTNLTETDGTGEMKNAPGVYDVTWAMPSEWTGTIADGVYKSVNDSVRLFYIRAIITLAYTAAPVLTQGQIMGFNAATIKAIVTAKTDASNGGSDAAPVIDYYLIGDLTDFAGSEAVTEYDYITAADGDATVVSAAPAATTGGPTETGAGNGGTVTITIGETSRDHDNTGTPEPYSIIVDAQGDVSIAKVYEHIKYVTRRGSDNSFWNTVTSSIDGEQYRGLEAAIYYDGLVGGGGGTLVEGEDIVGQNTWTARLFSDHNLLTDEGVSQLYITVADQQTSVATIVDNHTIGDSALADTVEVDTLVGTGGGIVTLPTTKASPFGAFTGSQIFGAPGVDFRNPNTGDEQAYILTDDLGTLRSPPIIVSFTVTNTRAGDRIYVARDTTTSGVIDKDQFGGMAAVGASATTITVAGTIDLEVPKGDTGDGGFIRVVETTKEEEHKYFYNDRVTGAAGTFTLTPITAASATAGTSPTVLSKTGGPSFITEGVAVGMLVQDTTNSDTYEVTAVTDLNNLAIRQVFGINGTFASGDAYTINETIQAYGTGDDLFDLILDFEEDTGTDNTPGTISNSFVKTAAADFGTVVQVRQGKSILPFELNQTQGDGDTSVTTVRTPDSIAT